MQRNRPTQVLLKAMLKGLAFGLIVSLFLAPMRAAAQVDPLAQDASGLPWQNLPLYGGPVTAIVADPASALTIYAGTENAGVFKSTDAGATWLPARGGLTDHPITVLLASETQPGTLYAGTEQDGVWKTTNGGATWSFAGTGIDKRLSIYNLIMDPTHPNILYCGVGGSYGHVYKSTDAGVTWQQKDTGIPLQPYLDAIGDVFALAVDPAAPSTLYAGTDMDGIFTSTNGGESWSPFSIGLPLSGTTFATVNALAVIPTSTPGAAGQLAALYASDYYVYENGAWKQVNEGIEDANHSIFVAHLYYYSGNPSIIYSAGSTFNVSTDGGKNWTQRLGWPTSSDIAAVAFHPSAPDTVYAASDYLFEYGGGVWKTTDQGLHWDRPARDVDAHNVTSVTVDPFNAQKIYVGSGSVGSGSLYYSENGGQTWSRGRVTTGNQPNYMFGEINQIAVDPQDTQKVYAAAEFRFYASSDGGQTFVESNPANFLYRVVVPRGGPRNVVYASSSFPGEGIIKSINGGVTWTKKNNGIPFAYSNMTCPVLDLLVDPNTPDTLWAATNNSGGVLQSTDGGESWVMKGLRETWGVSAIALHPTQSSTLLASAGDSSEWAIYRTVDGGQNWRNVLNLPVQANDIVYDPAHPEWVYLFTDGRGVLQSSDGGLHWGSYSAGIYHPALSTGAFASGAAPRLLAGGLGSGLYWVQPDLDDPAVRLSFLPGVFK